MKCEEALRLLALYLDEELEEGRRASFEEHLETCRSCYSRTGFERRLKEQLAALRERDPDSALEDRIRNMIRRFSAA